ncbi:Centromere/kinetochore protein zw10 [Chytridiales sp. JEL 0842]|nr:Centromere/kinetochore protein zw10 [Chytridiales sp. JEL 0842]
MDFHQQVLTLASTLPSPSHSSEPHSPPDITSHLDSLLFRSNTEKSSTDGNTTPKGEGVELLISKDALERCLVVVEERMSEIEDGLLVQADELLKLDAEALKQAQEAEKLAKWLDAVEEFEEAEKAFKKARSGGRLEEASRCLKAMELKFNLIPKDEEVGDTLELEKRLQSTRVQFENYLEEAFGKLLSINKPGEETVEVSLLLEVDVAGSKATLPVLLKALEETQLFESTITPFVRTLLKTVLLPAVETTGNYEWVLEPATITESSSSFLKWAFTKLPHQSYNGSVNTCLKPLHILSTFFSTFLPYLLPTPQPNLQLASSISSLLWPPLAKSIIDYILTPLLPSSPSLLGEYMQKTEPPCALLENTLGEFGLLKEGEGYVSAFVRKAEVHVGEERGWGVLREGRGILTGKKEDGVLVDSNVVLSGMFTKRELLWEDRWMEGEVAVERGAVEGLKGVGRLNDESVRMLEPLFSFPRCTLSPTTTNFTKLLFRTLIESLQALPGCPYVALQLYKTSRDLLEMYLGLVPVYHSDRIAGALPMGSAVFLNDCMFISHILLVIDSTFRQLFLKRMENKKGVEWGDVGFLDYIPRFRSLGARVFGEQVERQKGVLIGYLKECGGLEMQTRAREEIVWKGVRKCLHHFQLLGRVWKESEGVEVLSCGVYGKVMKSLGGGVLKEVLWEVEGLSDIAADESEALNKLLGTILESVRNVLPPSTSSPSTATEWMKLLERYDRVKEIMVMSFKDIMELWRSGGMDCLVEGELERLVRGLFADTELRRGYLDEIRRGRTR